MFCDLWLDMKICVTEHSSSYLSLLKERTVCYFLSLKK